jgi:hypothetical protein
MKNVTQIKKSTGTSVYVYLVDAVDGYTPETGITGPTVTISKAGGAFAAPNDGTWTELADGWYKVALDATDTDTLGALAINVVAAGCRNFADVVEVVTDTLEDVDGLVKRALGLNLENYYLDNATYSGGKLSSARIRIYDSADNVGGDSGVVATYNITAAYSGNDLATYKVTKA